MTISELKQQTIEALSTEVQANGGGSVRLDALTRLLGLLLSIELTNDRPPQDQDDLKNKTASA